MSLNLISGNVQDGIQLHDSEDTVIQGNIIGASKTLGKPRQRRSGSSAERDCDRPHENIPSRPAHVIAYNGADGVLPRAVTSASIAINRNSIFSQRRISASTWCNGVTANDVTDNDPARTAFRTGQNSPRPVRGARLSKHAGLVRESSVPLRDVHRRELRRQAMEEGALYAGLSDAYDRW